MHYFNWRADVFQFPPDPLPIFEESYGDLFLSWVVDGVQAYRTHQPVEVIMANVLFNACIVGLFCAGYVYLCSFIFDRTFGENSAFIISATNYWWIVFWLLPFSYYLFVGALFLVEQFSTSVEKIKNWYNQDEIAIADANLKLMTKCMSITSFAVDKPLSRRQFGNLALICNDHVHYCREIGLTTKQIKKVFRAQSDGPVADYINFYGYFMLIFE